MNNKLDKLFKESKRINIDDKTKLVIMSDCHRGDGNIHDNFLNNETLYEMVLRRYYINNYTYIELGDGDEMWEVNNYSDIINEHLNTFKLLKKFNDSNRLIMVYGNHDISKKSINVLKKYFYQYYDQSDKKYKDLLTNLNVYESLVLNYKNHDIFLLHGHQVDILNGVLIYLSHFLVRHIWKHFERFIINDPTGAAKNYNVSKAVEKRMDNWSNNNNKILISGHTHRPIFPLAGKSMYFNDGSCIHPNGITCIEIEDGLITLVRWKIKYMKKNISLDRQVIGGSELICNYFKEIE